MSSNLSGQRVVAAAAEHRVGVAAVVVPHAPASNVTVLYLVVFIWLAAHGAGPPSLDRLAG